MRKKTPAPVPTNEVTIPVPAPSAEAQKPLCEIVGEAIDNTLWMLHRKQVDAIFAHQRRHAGLLKKPEHASPIIVLPPCAEGVGILAGLVQDAGTAERAAVLACLRPLIDQPLYDLLIERIHKYRGPTQRASWQTMMAGDDTIRLEYRLAK